VGDPHGLADPQTADGGALANDRGAVGREREHAVERAGRVRRPHPAGQGGQEPGGLGLGDLEVGGGERRDRRGQPPLARPAQLVLGGGDRLVPVVADRVVVGAVAEVHRHVLVAQDRVDDLARLAGELGQRVGPDELVLHGQQGDGHARHRGHRRPPDPGAHQHPLALDRAAVGDDPAHAAVADVEAGDGDAALERHPPFGGAAREHRHDVDRPGDAVAGHVIGAEDRAGVQQRHQLGRLGGRRQVAAVDPVGARPAEPPPQLAQPLGRGRDLQRPDAEPARLAVEQQRLVQRDGVLRDPAGGARAVGLEHQAGRVGGGAAGLEQRPLVQDEHVRLAELGQVPGGAAADDAGADDHRVGPVAHLPPSRPRHPARPGCAVQAPVAGTATGPARVTRGRSRSSSAR
jgi:hypothetical protein